MIITPHFNLKTGLGKVVFERCTSAGSWKLKCLYSCKRHYWSKNLGKTMPKNAKTPIDVGCLKTSLLELPINTCITYMTLQVVYEPHSLHCHQMHVTMGNGKLFLDMHLLSLLEFEIVLLSYACASLKVLFSLYKFPSCLYNTMNWP